MTRTLDHLEALLAAHEDPSIIRVDLIHELSNALLPRAPQRIRDLNEEALALAQELDYQSGIGMSLTWIGVAQYMHTQYEAALQSFHQAEAALKGSENIKARAYIGTGRVLIQQSLGNYQEALAAGLKAITLYEALPSRDRWHGWNQMALGNTYLELHDYDQAVALTQHSLTIFEETNFQLGQARALTLLATIYQRRGDYRHALPFLKRSMALFREGNDQLGVSRTLNDMGETYRHLGKMERAATLYHESLRIREALGDRHAQCTTLLNLGRLHLAQQHLDQAIARFQEALAITEATKAKPKAYQAHEGLAQAYERQGQLNQALHHYKAFFELKDAVVGDTAQAKLKRLQISYSIENAQKEAEIERLKNVELQQLLHELKTTQAQLIYAEKMASLGVLTAGIAHEIKNPLNFINNFSEINRELVDELREDLSAHPDALAQIEDMLDDLSQNALVVAQHGRRADRIVQCMMQHANSGKGEQRPVNLNALIDEHVELAYHGKRAQQPDFNVQIKRSYNENVGTVEVVPQDFGRVILNLVGNAFDAVIDQTSRVNGQYVTTVTVSTRRIGDQVEIKVEDNGPGISKAMHAKIFEPFFTTKPAGSGTGLGLSLSYDIITQGHSGTLTVESEKGKGATFIVTLPNPETHSTA